MTFGSEARLPPDIVFYFPAPAVENVSLRANLEYTAHFTFKVFFDSFSCIRFT